MKIRQPSIDQAQTLLKQLRLRGTEEESIRQAIADNAGSNWEEFYETLFRYDAMRAMRTRLQQSKRAGLQVFRPRRDKLIDQWEQKMADTRGGELLAANLLFGITDCCIIVRSTLSHVSLTCP